MKIDIEGSGGADESGIQELYLNASTILRYLIGDDDQLETLIICNPANQKFFTTDQDIYNALGSVKKYDKFQLSKLVKLLELTTVRPARERHILREAWVEKTRHEALKDKNDDKPPEDKGPAKND